MKLLQQQYIEGPIKINKFHSQPVVTTIQTHDPKLPTKQRQHVIPDENGMLNVPNLVEQITQ